MDEVTEEAISRFNVLMEDQNAKLDYCARGAIIVVT
jgi:hypothetical protein